MEDQLMYGHHLASCRHFEKWLFCSEYAKQIS